MSSGNVIPYPANMTDPVVSGGIDLDSDTIVCVLVSASYTPNRLTHSQWSDVSAYQVTGTGYTAGGQALANKANTYDSGTGVGKWDADDVVWPSSVITAKYAVLVRRAGGSLASGDLLIGYLDLNTADGAATLASAGGDFTVPWNAAGIMTFSGNAS